jgi:glycosyltransferase involved in cell wall biosynthesis
MGENLIKFCCMKILHLSYSDANGGAFIGAKRLVDAQRKAGINAQMGVVFKQTNDPAVFEFPKNPNYESQNARRSHKPCLQTTNPILHSIGKASRLDVNAINAPDFDIVHLHWMATGTLSVEDIGKIQKPIVWTLRDYWPFCGAEHYPNILENDKRFIEGYTKENFPASSQGTDICRETWLRKKRAWKRKQFHFVALAHFGAQALQESALFKGSECAVIPNVVPKDIFRPLDRKYLRKIFKIPLHKKVIGFGAMGSINDQRSIKGGYYLREAMKNLNNKDNYSLIVFGKAEQSFFEGLEMPVFAIGSIENPLMLASIYNLCEVFVAPSLIETFCNTVHEALFCGIPVVAWHAHVFPEAVEHRKTGYLANLYDTEDLRNGIEFCCKHHTTLSKNALVQAESPYFKERNIIQKYLKVYQTALSSTNMRLARPSHFHSNAHF